MKITTFNPLFPQWLAEGSTSLYVANSSNSGYYPDVEGEPGDLTVVQLRQLVSLASNMGDNTLGSVLTTVQSSPWVAQFAVSSNSSGSNIEAVRVGYVSGNVGLDAQEAQEALDELARAIGWDVDVQGGVTPDGVPVAVVNDSSHNAFPGIVRLDSGRVLVVYRKGTGHLTAGDIYGIIGTMNLTRTAIGSWGTPFLIYSHATLDVRLEDAVSIVPEDDGTRKVVIAARLYDGSANDDPFIIICDDSPEDLTSTSTWSAPISVPLTTGTVQNYTQGHVQRLANGWYVLAVGWQGAGDHTVGMARWTGSLLNVSAATFETVASGADYAEICIQPLNTTGSLLALVRNITAGSTYKVTSTDYGDTWGSPSSAHDGFGYPMFRKLLSDIILTVYRDAPDGDTAWRTSTNDGTSWSSETILDSTFSRSVYATLLQTTATAVLCPYAIEDTGGSSATNADIRTQWFTDTSTFGTSISVSAGSNSTRVREVSTAGASTTLWSPFDHAHDGIGTITASSSNTMQRGTWNVRAGTGIALALSDTDGDGEFDTTTIVNTGGGGGGGAASPLASGKVVRNNVGSDLTTTSTTWANVDTTNLTIDLTTGGHRVMLIFLARLTHSSSGAVTRFNFSVDGTAVVSESAGSSGLQVIRANAASASHGVNVVFVTDILSAGSHTFKPRWNTSAATATLIQTAADDHIVFEAIELLA